MKPSPFCLLAAALLAAAVPPAHAAIERTIEKSFAVQPGGSLHVESSAGEITVQASADPVVKIIVRERIRAESDVEADDILRRLDLTLEQHDNAVTATAEYPAQALGLHFGSWPPVQVDFTVTVPASFAAELRTAGGNIKVGDLAGTLQAHTSGGNIRLGKLGADVDASTSGGNVSLDEGRGAVRLRTSGGHILVERAVGPAELRTSGGNIKVVLAENTVQASTSGGNVQASLSGAIKGDCELRTSGGRVEATVAPIAAFNLDASTSGGRIEAPDLTITHPETNRQRSRLTGVVNGGGPRLTLHSSGGNIEVRTF
jgi:Putative adhesin